MLDHRILWRFLVSEKRAQSYHVVQYHVLRALERAEGNPERAKKYLIQSLTKAFAPLKQRSRLENGHAPWGALERAAWSAIHHRNYIKPQDVLGAPWKALEELEGPFVELCRWIEHGSKELSEYNTRRYVYIFVRKDLEPVYQLIQAAHVAYVAGHALSRNQLHTCTVEDIRPDQIYFTVVGVRDEEGLLEVTRQLTVRQIGFQSFIEPDIGNQVTAIATDPILARNRGELLGYKLLTFD